ncbi:hypothetical protein Clacol_007046 [Clathrus columnatus]|uniref:Inactive metallocarboxypeptidase ECM14 n=1 Tax=Clathrus columnatus TaxID=1419009 RepID=A0AAV5AK19_9AGAM|nr:hypothetical protein Clacol_007046 [Clathrus columnatus]
MFWERNTVLLLLSFLSSINCLPQQIPLQWSDQSPVNTSLLNDPFSDWTFHETYHPLREVEQYIHTVAAFRSDSVKLDYIGWSNEKRPLTALSITHADKTKKKLKKTIKKPAFVIMGAQHAREWIATSAALYIAHTLLLDKKNPHSINKLLDDFSEQGYGWEPSSSPHEGPCAPWYPGEYPFQAPEVRALADYFNNTKDIVAFIDLRSYGQMISIPYSYSCDTMPRDAEDILEAAYGAAAASKAVHGLSMKVGQLCNTLYRAPGNVVDWMYEENHVKYSYAVHLRDTGTYGYVLPTRHIKPAGEETAGLISYLAKFILEDLEFCVQPCNS